MYLQTISDIIIKLWSTLCPRTGVRQRRTGVGQGQLFPAAHPANAGLRKISGFLRNPPNEFSERGRGGIPPKPPFRPAIQSRILLKIGSHFVVQPYQNTTFGNFSDFLSGGLYSKPVFLWADFPERQDEVRLPRDFEILSRFHFLIINFEIYDQSKIFSLRPQVH